MNFMFYHAIGASSKLGRVQRQESFFRATPFNCPNCKWDVFSVTDMSHMLSHAASIHGDISTWVVLAVSTMNVMFDNAPSFNDVSSKWDVAQ
jgi:hypothetical protein